MSQTTKRMTMPRTRFVALYDPDPEPDPSPGLITILVLLALGLSGLATVTNPNLWNNFLIAISPKVAEAEEEKKKNIKAFINMIMIIAGLLAAVGFIYIMWRRKESMKIWKKRRRRRR